MPICVLPLLDRIDIHVEVPRVDYDKLTDDRLGEPSEAIRRRVERARKTQRQRFDGTPLICNADMGPGEVRRMCKLDEAGRSLVRAAMQQLQMSARAFHRILKLSVGDCVDPPSPTWPVVRTSRPHTWRRRFSIDRDDQSPRPP